MKKTLLINGNEIEIAQEKNLLEVIRKANIELPTFCYHSELSVYGACRLCLVEIEGRGIQPACSTLPEQGLKIKTHSSKVRAIRKITIELLLAKGGHDCTTCGKSGNCQLQKLAHKLGITHIRFKKEKTISIPDSTAPSIIRDPNKCVLCGDCVRMCSEIQSIGAIDFANRGKDAMVLPAFAKNMNQVECVHCGQCARVCPTGALTIKPEIDPVWQVLNDPSKTVVAQVAPAVRVAIGEEFGFPPGTTCTGQMVSALRNLGFDKVFDTSFTADLTVVEEGNEFIKRFTTQKDLPLFTSCCPAWVKFTEQYYPDLLKNLSSCKSPQQMFGSVAKKLLPGQLNIEKKDLVVVSIMPCTAKKYEARREEFTKDGIQDVDFVITTQELARMIKEGGMDFKNLAPDSFDLPLGFKTGAGVIFGNSGGVSEAVLRYVSEKLEQKKSESYEFKEVRGGDGIREFTTSIAGHEVKMAIVHSLGNARKLVNKIQAGQADYDIVEVMACPGGCIGGAGQPDYSDQSIRNSRTSGLYKNEKMIQLHKSQENPYLQEVMHQLSGSGEEAAKQVHHFLHTSYQTKKRIIKEGIEITSGKLEISVCFGTGCYLKGSQKILTTLLDQVKRDDLQTRVGIKATFCFEKCGKGPVVSFGNKIVTACTPEMALEELKTLLIENEVFS
ncbi:MAG: (2Fe-2S)-binding protein [Spirochaetales bacterium]|nr:(2Fe-2S)-binding protein [Spirochaetales bacterium]